MATSGSVSVAATKYDTLKFSWWQNWQDIASNATNVGWQLELIAGSYGYISSSAAKNWAVSVNGAYYSGTNTIGISNNATKILASGSTTIGHNADGSKTFSFSFSQQFDITFSGSKIGTVSGSGTGTLNSIPRQATVTGASDFNDEQNPTITFSNAGGFPINARLEFNGYHIRRDNIANTGSYTIVLTEAERNLLRQQCTGKTMTVRQVIATRINSTSETHWSWIDKTFTVINDTPTLSPVVEITDNLTKELTGNSNTIIKGVSTVNYAINAAAYKEATINGKWVLNNGVYKYENNGTFTNVQSGYFLFAASDSRGRYIEKAVTKGFVDYVKLTCNAEINIALTSEELATVTIKIYGNYFNNTFGAITNDIALAYRYKTESGDYGEWVHPTASLTPTFRGNTYELTVTIENLDYRNACTIQCAANDKVAYIATAEQTVKAVPVFDWSEKDFNFNVPVTIKGDLVLTGNVLSASGEQECASIDFPIEQGEKDGWTYRNWKSGIGECWKIVTINTAITGAWGNMFVGDTKMTRQNYPFPFKSKPVEQANLMCGSNAAWLFAESNGNGVNGGYASAIYNVCRPSQVATAQNFYILLYAKGELM